MRLIEKRPKPVRKDITLDELLEEDSKYIIVYERADCGNGTKLALLTRIKSGGNSWGWVDFGVDSYTPVFKGNSFSECIKIAFRNNRKIHVFSNMKELTLFMIEKYG